MNKTNIRRLIYHIRHNYLTMNTAVIAIAFFIAASWAWGAVSVMERNYNLQKEVDSKRRDLLIAQLETANLEFENRYYKTDEYRELAAREKLGLAKPNERVLILPPNTLVAQSKTPSVTEAAIAPSNFQQWMNFIFGGNSQRLQ